ncbi:MAG: sensor domain-containing diguanylate cyclase [Planctomycetota bacterium]|jgi:diguanylate cyclase (GGDEF)-like protein/PAS domain S-box-containing protein
MKKARKDEAEMRADWLSDLVNDIFAGIAEASQMLPGGGPALTEDIARVIARRNASRHLADHPLTETASDAATALRQGLSSGAHQGILDPDTLSIEEVTPGRIRVEWDPRECPFPEHCRALKTEGLTNVCPCRLYTEQLIALVTGHAMSSISVPSDDAELCAWEVFPVSTEMLRPIERIRRNTQMLSDESRAAKSMLSTVQAQHRLILETIADAIVLVDEDHNVTYLNPRACGVFALREEQAVGRRLREGSVFGRIGDLCVDAAGELGKWEGDAVIENRTGDKLHNIYHARFSPFTGPDGARLGTLLVLEDVTREELLKREIAYHTQRLEITVEQKTSELVRANARLEILAKTDSLTGLANRRLFEETLRKEIKRSQRGNLPVGILVMDIDNFKQVNDVLGHQKGDEVLIWAASVLTRSVRESDTVARWGGDEFIILLPQSGREECLAVAERIRNNALIDKASIDLGEVNIDFSVGWASEATEDARSLVAAADDMMYGEKTVKKAGIAGTEN